MFSGFLYSIFIALIIGFANPEKPFRLLFSIPLGFGLCSVFYFLFLLTGIQNILVYKIFEFIIAVVASFFIFTKIIPPEIKIKKISLSLAFANLTGLLIFLKYYINNSLGSWDGFRIWNTKAEFMFRDISLWKNMFLQPHFLSHNDYPLFLPSSTARIWQYTGNDNSVFNITLAIIFTFSAVYMLYFAIKHFQNKKIAQLFATVLMLTPVFLVNGASQCADIPLSLFILASIISLFLYFEKKNSHFLIFGTVFAGFSAWVKNEGLMFFLVFLLVTGVYFLYKKSYKNLFYTAAASLPFIALIFLFKLLCNSPNDLIAGFFAFKTYTHLFDLHNYLMIIKSLVLMLIERFWLLFLLIIPLIKGVKLCKNNKEAFYLSLVIFILMCLGYFMTYILSPHDLDWLLTYSLDRIILHVLPLFLFLYALCLKIGQEDTEN